MADLYVLKDNGDYCWFAPSRVVLGRLDPIVTAWDGEDEPERISAIVYNAFVAGRGSEPQMCIFDMNTIPSPTDDEPDLWEVAQNKFSHNPGTRTDVLLAYEQDGLPGVVTLIERWAADKPELS